MKTNNSGPITKIKRLSPLRPSTSKLPTLIVADDEPALRILLTQFFQNSFIVETVDGGQVCLDYLENDEAAVVILDLNMPDMSGLEVIKKVRQNPKLDRVAIIMLSSAESSNDRIQCLNAGADDFVVKPFNPRELEARINAILRRINH